MAPRFDSPSSDSPSFSKPTPRPPKSPAQSAQIRVQNRRREYLVRHPGYFKSIEHEFADPLLYDNLVRRFQSAAEREAEGRAKGYGRILESSLARSEERREKTARACSAEKETPQGGVSGSPQAPENMSLESACTAPEFVLQNEFLPPPRTKEEGQQRWWAFLQDRFVHGGDDEFEYARVDGNDEYDVLERKEQEEAWFDAEDPDWASDTSDDPGVEGQRMKVEKVLEGETGIQDF